MNNFIVIEGICCSGKTTLCNRLKQEIGNRNRNVIYNHGAMTYTEIGREFYESIKEMDVAISTLYFMTDLIINTEKVIVNEINYGNVVIQDRYYNSIATYIKAYGEYTNKNLDIYRTIEILQKNDYILTPSIEVFCILDFEVILQRFEKSKDTQVHKYYKENPSFLRLVYNELLKLSSTRNDAIIVDTNSESSIQKGLYNILSRII